MKKVILFLSLAGSVLISSGQDLSCTMFSNETAQRTDPLPTTAANHSVKDKADKKISLIYQKLAEAKSKQLSSSKSANNTTPVTLFSSQNVYTSLLSEQTCIAYNPDINAIMFTARGHTGVLGTSNDICTAISTNSGTSFSSAVSVGTTGGNNRYPSGVIYNPAGNTVASNAKKVFTAPITNGTGWSGNKFATTAWNNTGMYYQVINTSGNGDMLVRGGLDVAGDGYAHTASLDYSSTFTYYQGNIFRGTYNNTTSGFEWTQQQVSIPFYHITSTGAYAFNTNQSYTAFSPNGQTGYTIFIGSDGRAASNDLTSYQPIVFKTTNSGQSWTLMGSLASWLVNNPVISDKIYPLRRTMGAANPIYKPYFAESDAVVDNNGNLHIIAVCKGAYSDHSDSLSFTYTYEKGAIFDISNAQGGDVWAVRLIDTLETRQVPDEESGYGAGSDALGWDHRLQASRSADGDVVIAIWSDTDSEFFGVDINLYPDIRGQAYRITDGYTSLTTDFTIMQSTYGENYFHFVAPVCITSGNTYTIPVTFSDIRTTNDPGLAVYHKYLKGVTFTLGPNLGINASFIASTSQGVAPLTVQFTNTSTGNPTSYLWNFDDYASGAANNSTLANPSHIFNNPGSYNVSLHVQNATGSDSAFTTITVDLANPLSVSVTADPDNICEGESSQLMAQPVNGTGNYTYSWTSNPAGFASNLQSPVAVPDITTTYTVEVNDGNSTVTGSVTVTVDPLPEQPTTPEGPGSVDIFYEPTSLYTTTATTGASSYQWEISPQFMGVLYQNETQTIVSWQTVGEAHIVVKAVNDCGEIASESKTVIVENTISTGNQPEVQLTVYPNPFTNQLIVVCSDTKIKSAELVTVDGVIIRHQAVASSASQISILTENIPSGAYIIRIETDKGTFIRKVFKN